MNQGIESGRQPLFLGIECGGTRTVACLADATGGLLQRMEFGPANLRLLKDEELVGHFQTIADCLPRPDAVAIGMAGARAESDRERIRKAAVGVWGALPVHATNDLETALMAAEEPALKSAKSRAKKQDQSAASVLVLSGTGSCCYGQTSEGKTVKIGGWGHILGDKGSGYEIGLRAMKAVVYYFDRDGVWPALGERILRALQLNEPNELITWAQSAGKTDIAALAVEVFQGASARDKIARDILEGAAASLAKDAVACAGRLAKKGGRVRFVLAGSVLLKQPGFARQVSRLIEKQRPKAVVAPLTRESVWGAVELARRLELKAAPAAVSEEEPVRHRKKLPLRKEQHPMPWDTAQIANSPTEKRNPLSMKLDRMSVGEAIELFLAEDAKIPAAVLAEKKKIEWVVRRVTKALKEGGRLFYAGAGTSGRLGILDASECPPTFRTPPEWVQGIIAGGQRAIWSAVEGAEDDVGAGEKAIAFRGVTRKDVVVGIAASGRTPFVWGAMWEAKRRGAATALVCFNPSLQVRRDQRPDVIIAPDLGPEILTGSTRLKSGTATKLILNIFTTLAMVRIGKVIGNLMVDLNPSNVKLRDRAVRIVRELTGVDAARAEAALEASGWVVKEAWRKLKTGTSGG